MFCIAFNSGSIHICTVADEKIRNMHAEIKNNFQRDFKYCFVSRRMEKNGNIVPIHTKGGK